MDLGTCREKDILITTGNYEEIKDFKEIKFKISYFADFKRNEDKSKEEPKKQAEIIEVQIPQKDKKGSDEELKISQSEIDKIPKKELPPFNDPLTIKDANGSTYIENNANFQKTFKKGSSRLML